MKREHQNRTIFVQFIFIFVLSQADDLEIDLEVQEISWSVLRDGVDEQNKTNLVQFGHSTFELFGFLESQ
jgi:hypothetical protein